MPFQIGQRVSDYEILGVLGTGGMGTVYRVRHVISQRVEALKVLLPDLASQPELAARFNNEIRTLAAFDHPNIAQLHTAFQSDNQLLMVMEFVEGSTLADCAAQGRLSIQTTLGYMDQLLAALAYAHAQGVIHRDIKPSNVMIAPDSSVKLMDFGISKSASEGDLTKPGMTVGSLSYMSPEQARGAAVDARSDVYSVGVMLYELATGQKPFQADSAYALLQLQLNGDAKPPVELNPELPKALNEIILTALAKDPERRFQSAQAFKNALKSLTAALAASAVPTQSRPAQPSPAKSVSMPAAAPAQPALRSAGSHRVLWVTAGALCLVAVFALGAFLLPHWTRTRAAGSNTNASPPTMSSEAPPSKANLPSVAPPPAAPAPAIEKPTAEQPEPIKSDALPEPARIDSGKDAGNASQVAPAPGKRKQTAAEAVGRQQRVQRDADLERNTNPEPPAPPNPGPSGSEQVSQQMKERMIQLGSRAAAVREVIDRLKAQQAASGYGLRQDVSASFNRMQAYLDEADRAWQAGDAAAAGKHADQAEKEIDNLEKFTGK